MSDLARSPILKQIVLGKPGTGELSGRQVPTLIPGPGGRIFAAESRYIPSNQRLSSVWRGVSGCHHEEDDSGGIGFPPFGVSEATLLPGEKVYE